MTNNNLYDKFLVANKQKLKNLEIGLECSVNLETVDNVTKILAVNIEPQIAQTESLTGEASVNGNVVVSLVYLTDNGLTCNAEYISPFMAKFVDSKINPNSKVYAKVVSGIGQVQSLNGSVAKVDCAIVVAGFVLNNEEITYLNDASEDVCTIKEDSSYEEFVGQTNSEWIENMEIELKEPIKQILSSTCDVFVKNVENGTNYVAVSCELVNKLLYLTTDENSTIKTIYTKTNIKQEIECEYSTKETMSEVEVCIQKHNIKNNITEKEDNIKVDVLIPLNVCIRVFKTNSINLITDLYSTQNLTNVTTKSYQNSVTCEPIIFEKKVEGSLTLSDDEPRIDKLLAVNYSKVIVTNEYIENNEYSVSGVISSNLIYFNEDEATVNSIDVEIPFVLSTQTNLSGELLTDLEIAVCDVDVMVKKGRDVYVDALVKIRTLVCQNVQSSVISSLDYTEPVSQKDCAIEIYFAKKGERVWDIAKSLYIIPQTIYNQNPEISDVLEEDVKLAIYYQKINDQL